MCWGRVAESIWQPFSCRGAHRALISVPAPGRLWPRMLPGAADPSQTNPRNSSRLHMLGLAAEWKVLCFLTGNFGECNHQAFKINSCSHSPAMLAHGLTLCRMRARMQCALQPSSSSWVHWWEGAARGASSAGIAHLASSMCSHSCHTHPLQPWFFSFSFFL